MSKQFSLIVAYDQNKGIGKNNQLPWHLPKDMAHFKQLTTTAKPGHQNLVIMGRKTWDSLPEKYRPLPNRHNMVVSKNTAYSISKPVLISHNLETTLKSPETLVTTPPIDEIFIIGGMSLYEQAITHPLCSTLYITVVHHRYDCDAFFPKIPARFTLTDHTETIDQSISLSFNTYKVLS